ncbi:RDD family protein [Ramlibacter henchirensis]|nr:RDD family protein [Ramlibacter henchirensis]
MTPPPRAPGGAAAAVPPSRASLIAPPLPRRMACWLYEGVLMFGVVVPAGLLFSVATQMRHGLDNRQGLIAFLFAVLAAYFVWFWSKGQTLAMKTWRIRVVDRYGQRVRPLRALMRYVFSYLWLLPPLAAFQTHRIAVGPVFVVFIGWVAIWALLSRFHPERQFWHDALAGTRLVEAPPPSPRAS